jgi:chromosome segregation ATPase
MKQVARLQEIEKKLNGLVEKSEVDFNKLKVQAESLKSQYEKENKSSADELQKLKSLLTSEQSKNTESIMKLKDELKAKEVELSKLQSTSSERSQAIADMEAKLEQARKQSERTVEENKKKIQSMNSAFEKELERNKAAHQAELERLRVTLQKDISSLQRDLDARSNVITDLKAKLDASTASNKKMTGEIVGLQSERRSTETLLKESSQSLKRSEQEIERLSKQFQALKQSDSSNEAKIESLRAELNDKSSLLNKLQSQLNSSSLEKERLLADLSLLKQWKEKSQASLSELLKEVARGPVDNISEKLTKIKNEMSVKDTQLNQAKSATAALLNRKEAVASSISIPLQFKQGQEIGFGVTGRAKPSGQGATPSQSSASNAPMSGWAGYKNKQWGGYLDNLASPTSTATAAAPVSKKSDYKKAEREYLLEAKTLAAVAFQSFEEARKLKGDDQKYKDALAKANQEKAKVDELLAKAREMKELNEKNSMGP